MHEHCSIVNSQCIVCVSHLQGRVMDKIFEVDSTAVLSKLSEAAVTHCRQKSEEEKGCETWKREEKKRRKRHIISW